MKILRQLRPYRRTKSSDEGLRLFDKHIMPFLLEKDKWEFVDEVNQADIVPFLPNPDKESLWELNKNQTALILNIFHIGEPHTIEAYRNSLAQYKEIFPNILIVHKNLAIKDEPGMIHYDSMFNRQKLYFTDFDKIENHNLVWTAGADRTVYTIPAGKENIEYCKYFLSPGLVYGGLYVPRMRYRAGLRDYLTQNFIDKGFINDSNKLFMPNKVNHDIAQAMNSGKGGFWYPVSDEYYKKSYVSVYVETLTVSAYNTKCVTEKTFDPLIKGNFILPFSYSGFIKDLVIHYGFKLPPFIDYGYDKETDNDVRFSRFLSSVDRLFKNHTPQSLRQKYEDFKWILDHNRNVFFARPYDTLYDKIKAQVS